MGSDSERKGSVISETYLPDCTENETGLAVADQSFEDFDAQSEQLSGHDQEYFQLSSGAFSGRFVSAFLDGGVSLHVETANQSLEQYIGCPQDMLNIGLVIDGDRPFQANGFTLDTSNMMVTPPGSEINILSPAGGTILAICIEKSRLSEWSAKAGVTDPITIASSGIAIHKAPDLAQSLRGGAVRILRSLLSARRGDAESEPIGAHFLSAILAQFSLHQALGSLDRRGGANEAVLFENARSLMLSRPEGELDYGLLCAKLGCTTRAIQLAFARHTDMSPTRYLRTIRLNEARRMLLSKAHSEASIGDIAARSGFWNWSRFTENYKRQFGELPSETRHRIQ